MNYLNCQLKVRELQLRLETSRARSKKQIYAPLEIGGKVYDTPCLVVKGLTYAVILGIDFLVENDVIVDTRAAKILIGRGNARINTVMKFDEEKLIENEDEIDLCSSATNDLIESIEEKVNSADLLDKEQKAKLSKLLISAKRVFEKNREPVKNYVFRIQLTDETPFKGRSYPIPVAYQEAISKQIEEMLEEGIIKRATTAYVNPIVIVKKQNGTLRLCLDARYLNSLTIPYRDVPPKIDEILLRFANKGYFSSTDFSKAYYQMRLHPKDQKYTGFVYKGRSYVFQRVPFGLRNSGAALVQCLDEIMNNAGLQDTTLYVDDILVHSTDFERHLEALGKLLPLLIQNNLVLNLEKSHFCVPQIKFLGYEITKNGIQMGLDRIKEIEAIPRPKNNRQLKRILGVCNYFSRFCYNYALTIAPLYRLLRKDQKWEWTELQQKAFDDLKHMFLQTCTISHPDFTQPMYLQTDSSDLGVGAMLYQVIDGETKIINLVSTALKGPQIRFTTSEKEAYAVVWALTKLKNYLMGRSFVIKTDHKALIFLNRCNWQNDRLMRWSLWLQQFDFRIEYVEGQKNVLPDLLSRQFPAPETNITHKGVEQVNAIDLKIPQSFLWDWSTLADLQNHDDEISKVKRVLEGRGQTEDEEVVTKLQRDPERWRLTNDMVLIRLDTAPITYKIWIPKAHAEELINYVHAQAAHYGSTKIKSIISELCYWKNMDRDVKRVIKSCETCMRTKFPNRSYAGTVTPIIPEGKNDIIAVDLYGPLPKSRRGNKYIMVIIDLFTKFTQVYPINKITTNQCLRQLEKYLAIAGQYRRVLSDHGTQFTSQLWKTALQEKNLTPIYSSIRHPQSNPSERVMKEMSRLFRTYCSQKHDDWTELVPHVNRWLNHVPHESIGMSPYEAHFARKPPHVLGYLDREDVTGPEPYHTEQQILDRLRKAAEERKKKVKSRPYVFRVNQKVMLRTPKVSVPRLKLFAKFFHLYEGPYTVTRLVAPNAAELIDEDGRVIGTYNFFNLKPY